MNATEKLTAVMRIILIGFIGACIFHFTMKLNGYLYPLNTFLFTPDDRFMDFFNLYEISKYLDPYFSEKYHLANYFPITYLVFFPFTFLPRAAAFAIYIYLFCRFLFWFTQSQIRSLTSHRPKNKIINLFSIIIFLSFPVLFCLDRGNIDGLIFIILSLSTIAFLHKKYYLSAIPLAIASGMKLYPLVFIVLFIKKKRWKELFFCLTLMVLLTLVSLVLFKTDGISKNVLQLRSILSQANHATTLSDGNLNFSSSLFSLLKMIIWYLPPYSQNYNDLHQYLKLLHHVQLYYALFTLIAFGAIAFYVIFKEKSVWKQIMLLTCCMILFPYISADYKLIFLFIPFLLFVTTPHTEKLDAFYTGLFALLFIPKNYFIFKGPLYYLMPNSSLYSVMDLINVGIMLVFMVSIVWERKENINPSQSPPV
jgi:hypothetical protein